MASDIGTAYVQIMPSTKGISGSISKVLSGESVSAGNSAGESLGNNLVGKLKGIIAAAGIGATIKAALDAGGALQQSLGGIDTLYSAADGSKEAVKALEDYSEKAAAAGVSANSYAEQATAFGASLKAAYGGDVKKAAEAANTAIMDMADNSAKMGTDIGSVQMAYQGFAKQNYTMLDNLKLGYGGTKTEMERLLKDAEKISGVKYDINNLGDVYSAIHVIQKDLNLTGVAAKEAKTTFTGSFGAMKSAATNFVADLTLGRDLGPSLNQLAVSTSDFVFGNLIPMLGKIVTGLPGAIATFVQAAIPAFSEQGGKMLSGLNTGFIADIPKMLNSASSMLNGILAKITEALPGLLDQGSKIVLNMANGLLAAAPDIITTLGNMLTSLVDFIMTNAPVWMEKGTELVINLMNGLWNAMPGILSALGEMLGKMIRTILSHLPDYVMAGLKMVNSLASSIVSHIPDALLAIVKLGNGIIKGITGIDMLKSGKDLIDNFVKGITSGFGKIRDTVKKLAGIIKDFIGFSEPDKGPLSRFHTFAPDMIDLFTEGVDQNIPQLSSSIKDMASVVGDELNNPIKTMISSNISGAVGYSSPVAAVDQVDPYAIYEAVENGMKNTELKVVLNGRELSRSLKEMGVQFA